MFSQKLLNAFYKKFPLSFVYNDYHSNECFATLDQHFDGKLIDKISAKWMPSFEYNLLSVIDPPRVMLMCDDCSRAVPQIN